MKKAIIALMVIVIVLHNNGVAIAEGTVAEGTVAVPILLYHHISADENHGGSLGANMYVGEFREHMLTLKENGYNPIPLQQYYDYVLDSSVVLPPNPIVITFDDGYLSNYEEAFPILRELEFPATIFVVTSSRGKRPGEGVNLPHFTWEQAREMEDSGLIDIQSHSHTHLNASNLSVEEMQRELRLSRYLIETNLNKTVEFFAFPGGDYNEQVVELSRGAGYKMQVMVGNTTIGEFSSNLRSDGLDAIRRLTIWGGMTSEELLDMIERANAERQS